MRKLLFILLLIPVNAWAAEYTCGTNGVDNSCTPSGLQSQINSAAHGDTINIATGTHNWTSSVTVNKRLTITGGGTCPDCGEDGTTALSTASWDVTLDTNNNMAFLINGSAGTNPSFCRISGLFIDGDPPNHSYSNGANTGSIVMDTNNTMRYRIDNIRFRPSGDTEQSSIRTNSGYGGFGVIDHVYISTTGAGSNGRFIHNTGHGGDAGDTDWSYPVQWGSENFHFLEDITFIFPPYSGGIPAGIEDQQGGGRCVIRYCYSENANLGNHGTESGWPARSGVAQEIYENHIETQGNMFTANYPRGGSMYVYNNYFEGFQEMTRWRVQRLYSDYGCGVCGAPSCAGIDGPGPPDGYPCIDQVGTGVAAGVGINNTQPQGRNPYYVWNNTRVNTPIFNAGDYSTSYVTEGVDVVTCEDSSCAPSGYVAYTYPHPFVSDTLDPLEVTITQPTSSPTHISASTPITLGGTASSGYTVDKVQWANSATGLSGTATGTAIWSDSVVLIPGDNTITATATDANSDTSSDQIIVTYDSDTNPPSISITDPTVFPTYGTETSPIQIGGIASDTSGINRVTWTNSGTLGSGTASGTTAWTFTTDLALGDNVIVVRAYDDSAWQNNNTDQITVAYSVDNVDPVVTITGPVNNSTYDTSTTPLTISGTASDASGIAVVSWYNDLTSTGGNATGTANWSAVIALATGANEITITATDGSSNANTGVDVITVTYPAIGDFTNPNIAITSPTTLGTYSTSTTPLPISGTSSDESGIASVVWANALTAGGGTANLIEGGWNTSVPLTTGDNLITVTATDASANANTASDSFTVTYPLPGPSVPNAPAGEFEFK